jgi:hypothetical protein
MQLQFNANKPTPLFRHVLNPWEKKKLYRCEKSSYYCYNVFTLHYRYTIFWVLKIPENSNLPFSIFLNSPTIELKMHQSCNFFNFIYKMNLLNFQKRKVTFLLRLKKLGFPWIFSFWKFSNDMYLSFLFYYKIFVFCQLSKKPQKSNCYLIVLK